MPATASSHPDGLFSPGRFRRRLTLAGRTLAQTNAEMREVAALYSRYLLQRQSPAQIFAAEPRLQALWPDRTAFAWDGRRRTYAAIANALGSSANASTWSTDPTMWNRI